MDFNTLVAPKSTPGSLADWAGTTLVQPSAAFIIEEAQDWIFRRLRHWRMIPPPVTSKMPNNTFGSPPYIDYIAFPSDMLEPDYMLITGQLINGNSYYQVIQQRTMQEILAMRGYDQQGNPVLQQPRFYWYNNTNFVFDQPPDLQYPILFTYFQQPLPLSSNNPTNFLTQWCKRLLWLAIRMCACEYLKEVGQGQFDRSYWEQLASKELMVVQAESDRSKRATQGKWIEGFDSPFIASPGYPY